MKQKYPVGITLVHRIKKNLILITNYDFYNNTYTIKFCDGDLRTLTGIHEESLNTYYQLLKKKSKLPTWF